MNSSKQPNLDQSCRLVAQWLPLSLTPVISPTKLRIFLEKSLPTYPLCYWQNPTCCDCLAVATEGICFLKPASTSFCYCDICFLKPASIFRFVCSWAKSTDLSDLVDCHYDTRVGIHNTHDGVVVFKYFFLLLPIPHFKSNSHQVLSLVSSSTVTGISAAAGFLHYHGWVQHSCQPPPTLWLSSAQLPASFAMSINHCQIGLEQLLPGSSGLPDGCGHCPQDQRCLLGCAAITELSTTLLPPSPLTARATFQIFVQTCGVPPQVC